MRLGQFVAERFSAGEDRQCIVRACEAGGGGDCLFHSIAAALELMVQIDPEAATHVLARLPLHALTGTKSQAVAHLRRMSVDSLAAWSPEVLLDYVLCRAMDERLGNFPDGWSPRRLLITCGFECLLNCESVLAFGDAVDGDPGDITMRVAFTDARAGGAHEQRLLGIPQGRTCLEQLRASLQAELMVSGNHHWGDQTDVQNLSSALNIGILMCCDRLQHNRRECFYNIGSQKEVFPYWICIWWEEPVHFRLAQFAWRRPTEERDDDVLSLQFSCFWSDAALPSAMRAHYRSCNRMAN